MIAETGMSSVDDETLAATRQMIVMSFGKLLLSVGPAVDNERSPTVTRWVMSDGRQDDQ